MLLRLLLGLLKGIVVGGLAGYGLAAAGFALPAAWMAYAAVAVVGCLMALIAGKPIWAKGARIEVGLKAAAGAAIACGLLFVARRWVNVDLPIDLSKIGIEAKGATLGSLSITSFAMVAALLGGFFDADHDPSADEEDVKGAPRAGKKRIAADAGKAPAAADMDFDVEAEAPKRRAGK